MRFIFVLSPTRISLSLSSCLPAHLQLHVYTPVSVSSLIYVKLSLSQAGLARSSGNCKLNSSPGRIRVSVHDQTSQLSSTRSELAILVWPSRCSRPCLAESLLKTMSCLPCYKLHNQRSHITYSNSNYRSISIISIVRISLLYRHVRID